MSKNTSLKKVFVIDHDTNDWITLFEELNQDSKSEFQFEVDQNEWNMIQIVSYSDSSNVHIMVRPNKKPNHKKQQVSRMVVDPDIILIRQLVQGVKKHDDSINSLYGLLHSNVLCVNSAFSVFVNMHRPIVYGELLKLRQKYGKEKFPLIDQYYYSDPMHMNFTPSMPIVVKVGTAEAGYGKMKFEKQSESRDFAGTITRYNDFITAESFIQNKDYDIRVQKIGSHIRAYKRMNPNWKGNVGTSIVEEIAVTPEFRFWAEKCAELFDGKMDILTVDAVRNKDGKYFILEINDTASGLHKENKKQDMVHIRDLAIHRLKEHIKTIKK